MAAKGDEEGAGASAAPAVVGLALGGPKSSAYVLRWALANFAQYGAPPAFKLIHVLTPVLAVPTPSKLEKLWIEKKEMLSRCKDTCDEYKVEAEVLHVEGKDVADTISSLVSQYQIQLLVVGNTSSKSPSTRRSSASRTACKICQSLPSFCTAYVVSKDGLSSVYSLPESESGSPSGSAVPKGNSGSSSTKEFTDGTSSRSDLDGSSGQGLPGLYDYLTGNAPVADKDRRIASHTSAESSISSQLQGSDKVPTKASSLQGLMLSDNKGSDTVPTKASSLQELMLSDNKTVMYAAQCQRGGSRIEKAMAEANSYEERRRRQMEENRRKLEELGVHLLAAAVREAAARPKPRPKRKAPGPGELRRSGRVAGLPEQPNYHEGAKQREYRGGYEAHAAAKQKAEELQRGIRGPAFVKPLTHDCASRARVMGVPKNFMEYLPAHDEAVVVVDEEDEEFHMIYNARHHFLRKEWRKFAAHHDLADGDCLVFQLIDIAKFKVYIFRASPNYESDQTSDDSEDEQK